MRRGNTAMEGWIQTQPAAHSNKVHQSSSPLKEGAGASRMQNRKGPHIYPMVNQA